MKKLKTIAIVFLLFSLIILFAGFLIGHYLNLLRNDSLYLLILFSIFAVFFSVGCFLFGTYFFRVNRNVAGLFSIICGLACVGGYFTVIFMI